jgi:hypothetical protein
MATVRDEFRETKQALAGLLTLLLELGAIVLGIAVFVLIPRLVEWLS